MKLVYKRNSAATALAEPEETFVSERADSEPSPAPAGALHRVYPAGPGGAAATPAGEDEYVPQRGSYGMRLRGGMPRSLAGRVLLGSGAALLLGAVTLTVAEIRHFLLHDPRFEVASSSEISVEGNEHISRADVLGIFGSDLDRNIFMIPLVERRSDLQRLPWVAHATIERLLPNQLRVTLRERTPIAFVRQGSHIGLVDGDGVLLDMPPEAAGDPHYSFPVLTGLAADDSTETRLARMDVYQHFMADLDSSGQHRSAAVSEVDVTNPEDVKALVTLNGADVLVHFGDQQFLRRFEGFARHLPDWRKQYPRLASADMRYERQVVLEMQGAVPVPAITPAALADAGSLGVEQKPAPAGIHHAVASVAGKHGVAPAKHAGASGRSAANEKLFRALAAQRTNHLKAERR